MKTAFLFLHPLSESLGSTVRVKELAISLKKLGVNTLILSPYETNHVTENGILVRAIPSIANTLQLSSAIYKLSRFIYYNRVTARKLLTTPKFQKLLAGNIARGAYEALKDENVDIVQAEQDIAIMPALRFAQKTGASVVVDLHNILAEELVAAGVISKKSKEFKVLQQQMAESLSQVNLTIVVSEQMKSYVHSEYGIGNRDIYVVPPGGRLRAPQMEERPFPPKVIFAGLVSFREHVDLFVGSMPIVSEKRSDVRFFITKKGGALKRIQKLAEQLKVNPNYFWYPHEKQFYEFMMSCHIGVLPSKNDLARRMGTPAKLFAYMSVGLPVVANDVGGWTDIIKQENAGILTAGNPQSFASAILELLDDTELRLRCGRRGLEAVKTRYSWDNSAKILLQAYKSLLN